MAAPLATGIQGVVPYLVLDYVTAESLDVAIRDHGPAPAAEALRVATLLAGALDFAAVVHVMHGGLHPRDVLVSSDDVRVTGIGVVAALERAGVTPPARRPYAAPERLEGRDLDRRADIFSLAAIMYELLSGRRLAAFGAAAADALPEVAGTATAPLRAAFARALAEDPAARFATGLAFAEAFRKAVAGEETAANTVEESPPVAAAVPGVNDVPPTRPIVVDEPALEPAADRASADLPFEREPEPRLVPVPQASLSRGVDTQTETPADQWALRPDAPPVVPAAIVPPSPPTLVTPTPPLAARVVERPASNRPIVLAWIIGIAMGVGLGYGWGLWERQSQGSARQPQPSPVATSSAGTALATGRDFTEGTVTDAAGVPSSPAKAAEPRATVSTPPARKAPANVEHDRGGRLLVRSTPAGARVFIDGRDTGETPATIRDLAPGPHRVRVVHDGYVANERRVVLNDTRAAQSLTFELERVREARDTARPPATPATSGAYVGELVVDSRPPGATVYVDGRESGRTPLTVRSIDAGEHAIRIEGDGYRRWSSSVRVVANERNRVTASLER
jgi:hypothetical protein